MVEVENKLYIDYSSICSYIGRKLNDFLYLFLCYLTAHMDLINDMNTFDETYLQTFTWVNILSSCVLKWSAHATEAWDADVRNKV